MADNNFFQFLKANRVKANDMLEDTVNYLVQTFKQSVDMFTYASSYGQILLTTKNYFTLVLFYIQDGITQMNMQTANRKNSVYGLSRLTGHNPVRGHSAIGEISMVLRANATDAISGKFIIIPNFTRLVCRQNNLTYILNLGADDLTVDIDNTQTVRAKIIEGSIEFQTSRGTGESLQSFEVSAPPNKMIDDNFIIVSVNGEDYEKYESLMDIPFGRKGVLVKTGITSGIDVFFGNKISTQVPPQGSEIRVDYLLTSGSQGNIPDNTVEFDFIDTAFDINGNEVNLNEVFRVNTELPPDFGADGEDIQLTKQLAPMISPNFIIHDERSIRYFLGRMNFFSVIKVFKELLDNENRFNLLLLPKVTQRLGPGEDYFNIDIDKFTLTEQEETRLLNMIDESGRKAANITLRTIDPEIRKSAMVILIEAFERIDGVLVRRDTLEKDIRNALSEYLLNNRRVNKIPHSDIVRILDGVRAVDTVKVIFVPENLGDVDSKGNLSVGERQIVTIRGDFEDSEGVFYEDQFNPEGETLGSVNLDISFVENNLR